MQNTEQDRAKNSINGDFNVSHDNMEFINELRGKAEAKITTQNLKICEEIIKTEQQKFEEIKATQKKLQEKIVQSKFERDNLKSANEALKNRIGVIRVISEEMRNYCVENDQLLQICLHDKSNITQAQQKYKSVSANILTNLDTIAKTKQDKLQVMQDAIQYQKVMFEENIEKGEKECSEMKDKLNSMRDTLQSQSNDFNEVKHIKEVCTEKISEITNDRENLEALLKTKQSQYQELMEEIQKQLHTFNECKEEKTNNLTEIQCEILKKEMAIKGIERAIKNQKEYNETIEGNKKAKEIQLTEENFQINTLTNNLEQKTNKLAEEEKLLKDKLHVMTENVKNSKALLAEECDCMNKTNQSIIEITQQNEELELKTEQNESILLQMQRQCTNHDQDIAMHEQNISSSLSKIEMLKKELHELQQKSKLEEQEMTNTISNRNTMINSLITESEELKQAELDANKTKVQEMSSIQIDFAAKMEQQTKQFKDKQNPLQCELDELEQKQRNLVNSKQSLQDELKGLNKEYDDMKLQIQAQTKENEGGLQIPFNVSEFAPTQHSATPAHSVPKLPFFLPFGERVRRIAFDELSGSSAEGNMTTFIDQQEMRKQKEMRRQLKEKRKQARILGLKKLK